MDDKIVKERKEELEVSFNKLKTAKVRLAGQAQVIAKAMGLLDDEIKDVQGAYKELCKLLGLNPDVEAKKNNERWKKEQAKPAEAKETKTP